MSPLFGHKDDSQQQASPGSDALQAEVQRLESLPLPQLAAEVMRNGFGPGGPGADESDTVTTGGANINAGPEVSDIAQTFMPAGAARADEQLRLRLYRVIAEGLQALEHASLVRAQMHTSMNGLDYALTRLGQAALEQGTVDAVLASPSS